jgi:hypothetical protein
MWCKLAWDLKAKGVNKEGIKQGLDVFGHELKIPPSCCLQAEEWQDSSFFQNGTTLPWYMTSQKIITFQFTVLKT